MFANSAWAICVVMQLAGGSSGVGDVMDTFLIIWEGLWDFPDAVGVFYAGHCLGCYLS
jgi:hypothetical protein